MRLKPLRRLMAMLAATPLLAGCEDAWRIDNVDNMVGDVRSYIAPVRGGGVPTVVRGAPFPGVAPDAVIARLRAPPSYPPATRFRPARAGDTVRLSLVFNPEARLDAAALCRGDGPAGAGGDAAPGFVVFAAVCNGARVLVSARLTAPTVAPDDPEAFTQAMRRLLQTIFAKG